MSCVFQISKLNTMGGKFKFQVQNSVLDFFFCKTHTFKGQIKLKADWHGLDSPKKWMNKFVLFTFLLFTANKKKCLFDFWENLNCFQFYLTFSIPSPSMKIQNMGGKVCLWCKDKTLLGISNKLFIFIILLTTHSNVLPLHIKQTFPPII